jgi:hypothetical protein
MQLPCPGVARTVCPHRPIRVLLKQVAFLWHRIHAACVHCFALLWCRTHAVCVLDLAPGGGLATHGALVRGWPCGVQMLKRGLFLLLAAAATLGTVRPPVPIAGGAKCPRFPFALCPRLWDERHVPSHEVDDVTLYGEGLVWREHWALWLLVASIALASCSAASIRGARPCSVPVAASAAPAAAASAHLLHRLSCVDA